ncbi:hypothetical protein [Streptomyces sp. NPDC097619]|uniref:hypothetical protein n=1 Tax=Streptomyces sp. NPDC097619 TaxID=3157228 RepID=UPI00331D24C3
MSTPAPDPAAVDPFAEALAEAAQTAVAAFRLMLTISDAVRRAAQKLRTGREEDLADEEARLAPGWAEHALRPVLDPRVLTSLVAGADWPALAGQLVLLQKAGVDLATFLPHVGQAAATVHQAVTANAARIRAAGTDRWADLLRATIPEGVVREAILASPAWPGMADTMGRLDQRGVDVAGLLRSAHEQGMGVDRAVASVLAVAGPAGVTPDGPVNPYAAPAPAPVAAGSAPAAAGAVPGQSRILDLAPPRGPEPAPRRSKVWSLLDDPAPGAAPAAAPSPAAAPAPAVAGPGPGGVSADARALWGPLTAGLTVPNDLDLADRPTALGRLGVSGAANSRLVTLVQDTLGSEQETALLVATRAWPLLAARMADTARGPEGEQGLLDRLHAGLGDTAAWRQAPPSELAGRMVVATLGALTGPPGAPVPDRPRVSAAAARSRSTTTSTGPAPGRAVAAQTAVPAHRRQAGPAPRQGRGR